MASQLLSSEDYKQILQEKYGTNNFEITDTSFSPLSENLEGFMGDHYILKITYKINNEIKSDNFFLKTKTTKTETQKKMTSNIFEKEIFLYDFLFKEFEKYNFDTNFAPKSYLCKSSETIVLEYLKDKDFNLFPRGSFFDLNHMKLSLKTLAKYHGNCICYEEKISEENNERFCLKDHKPDVFNEIFYRFDDADDFGTKFVKTTLDCIGKVVDIMEESEEWKKTFMKKLFSLDLQKLFDSPLPYRKTCCHGDLWSNNLLFKYENGEPVECVLVDYQVLRYHHLSLDVILILFLNTSREFRKQHFESLLLFYYDALEQVIQKNGFDIKDILLKEHFLEATKYFIALGVLEGASVRFFTLISPEILNDAVNSGGEDLENMMFTEKRSEMILEGCNKYKHFRKCVFDDIYDLDELI